MERSTTGKIDLIKMITMPKSTIIYQAYQEVFGRHLRSKEWVLYTGTLTIYARKTNPIVLRLKCEICDSFIGEFMEDKIVFKGASIPDVYGNVSKWYYKHGILFQV